MKIDWNVVPTNYRYLENVVLQNRLNDFLVIPWVEGLGRAAGLAERTSLGMPSGLSEVELIDLARVYHELLRREDNLALLHWHVGTRTKEVEAAAGVLVRLLSLLRELGEFGIAPFDEQLVVCELHANWQNLPPELEYLRHAIEEYGDDLPRSREDGPVSQGMYFFRNTMQMFFGERRRLRELAKRIEDDRDAIKSWYEDVRKSPEAGRFLELENILLSAEFLEDNVV